MLKYNRTKNSVRNITFGLALRLVNSIGAFLSRTILIYTLGIEYTGLDGLFTSILTVLNMAELGFNTAIVFKLYKPIAEQDTNAICSIINYYKKVYRILGIIVFCIGMLIFPFLDQFIKGKAPSDINIRVLYLIYLSNTCFSFWLFAYKAALLNAHQRNDLVSKISTLSFTAKYILQSVLLLAFRNYYVYAIIIPLTTLLINAGIAVIAKRFYPQYVCRGSISEKDKSEIRNKIKALMYNKVGVAIINGSDNIIISSFLGLTALGVYNSYYYVFSLLHSIFDVFYSGITGGLGNRIITESTSDNYRMFCNLSFINAWIVGWVSICLACLYEPFMHLWIGKENALGPVFSFIMALYFYIYMIRFIVISYKNAQGLWWQDRYRAILEGVVNLVLNVIMVRYIGMYGIVLSTVISMVIISVNWEAQVLFKEYFHRRVVQYYVQMLMYFLASFLIGFFTYFICKVMFRGTILSFVFCILLCCIIPNVLFYSVFRKGPEYLYFKQLILSQTKKLVNKTTS